MSPHLSVLACRNSTSSLFSTSDSGCARTYPISSQRLAASSQVTAVGTYLYVVPRTASPKRAVKATTVKSTEIHWASMLMSFSPSGKPLLSARDDSLKWSFARVNPRISETCPVYNGLRYTSHIICQLFDWNPYRIQLTLKYFSPKQLNPSPTPCCICISFLS